HRDQAAERKRRKRRGLDVRLRVEKCARSDDTMRRRVIGCDQRIRGEITDIAVTLELAPGPALAIDVEYRDALAVKRFRIEWRIMTRRAAQRRRCLDDEARLARDEAFSLDLSLERSRREVRPCGGDARIVGVSHNAPS